MTWQPIGTAPKDGTAIDLWIDVDGGKRIPNCIWNDDLESWEWVESSDGFSTMIKEDAVKLITHWMPLPAPPKV